MHTHELNQFMKFCVAFSDKIIRHLSMHQSFLVDLDILILFEAIFIKKKCIILMGIFHGSLVL